MTILKEVYAQGVNFNNVVDPLNGRITTLAQVYTFVFNLILGVGWSLVGIMLALGFIQYVMSKGEKTAVEGAQKWLTYSAIGAIGLFMVGAARAIIPGLVGSNGTNIATGVGGNVTF